MNGIKDRDKKFCESIFVGSKMKFKDFLMMRFSNFVLLFVGILLIGKLVVFVQKVLLFLVNK